MGLVMNLLLQPRRAQWLLDQLIWLVERFPVCQHTLTCSFWRKTNKRGLCVKAGGRMWVNQWQTTTLIWRHIGLMWHREGEPSLDDNDHGVIRTSRTELDGLGAHVRGNDTAGNNWLSRGWTRWDECWLFCWEAKGVVLHIGLGCGAWQQDSLRPQSHTLIHCTPGMKGVLAFNKIGRASCRERV